MIITSAEYANGLRLLADWIESNPDITLPSNEFSIWSYHSKEEAAKVMLALKPCDKLYNGDIFYIKRNFGAVTLRFVFSRSSVCTRKIVGTRVVPEKIEPAVEAKEEEIIPEHEENIYEWECEPILEEKKAEA